MAAQKVNWQDKKWTKDTKSWSSRNSFIQCDLVHNQYQQKSEVLYTFTPNKSYPHLLNVELSNLVFLETCNTEFDEIIITFTDQSGRPLKKEDKVNLSLLINKQKWHTLRV